jgi:hypothetical protein
MANKWIALNLLLLITAVVMGRELYQQYEQFKAKNDPSKIEAVSSENSAAAKSAAESSAGIMETQTNTDSDYSVISDKTLFTELRGRNEDEVAIEAPTPKPLPRPHPALVGTAMIGGQYTASVINQQAQQQARNTQLAPETWRVGDYYNGYRVASIAADQLVLESGGVSEVIPLNRAARRTPAAKTAAKPIARVVSIGPGGGTSGAMTVSTSAASAPGRVQSAQAKPQQAQAKPQQTQAKPQQVQPQQRVPVTVTTPNGDVVVSSPENVQEIIQAQPAQKPQQGAAAKPGPAVRQQPIQQRVVSSPFGEIIRPGSD